MKPHSSETQSTAPRPRRGPRLLLSAIVLFGTLAVLSFAASAYLYLTAIRTDGSPAPPVALQTGQPAPEFRVRTLDGEELTLSELRGQPVWLNFWGTWCQPCRVEMPDLVRVGEEARASGVRLVALNVGDTPAAIREFLEKGGYESLPVALDTGGRATTAYKVYGFPVHVFIDSQGRIQQVAARKMTGPDMSAAIRGLQ